MTLPARPFPQPPAQVQPYVAALGPELTVRFPLRFGGAILHIPKTPKGRSQMEAMLGADKVRALAGAAHLLQRRVPLASAWIAACLHAQGMAINEIARTIRVPMSQCAAIWTAMGCGALSDGERQLPYRRGDHRRAAAQAAPGRLGGRRGHSAS